MSTNEQTNLLGDRPVPPPTPPLHSKSVPIPAHGNANNNNNNNNGSFARSQPDRLWGMVRRNVSSLQSHPPSPAMSPAPAPGAPPPSPASPFSPSSPDTPYGDFSSPRIEKEDQSDMGALFMNRAASVGMGDAGYTGGSFTAARRASTLSGYGGATSGSEGTSEPAKEGEEEEVHEEPPQVPAYRWLKFAFLCLVMILPVGGSGEGIQTFFNVLADRGVFGDTCTDAGLAVPCRASHLQIATIIVVALSVMNVAGVASGLAIDAVGVRISAVVCSVGWAVTTGWSGLAPGSGMWWASGLVLQQCFNGGLFLCIFTGLLRQLFPDDEQLFAVCSSIASGAWDFGAITGYAYREVLKQPAMSLATNYAILGAVLGLVPAVIFQFAFEQPERKLTKEALMAQLAAMRAIMRKPFFWLLTATMGIVCAGGYSIIAYIGEILHWKSATESDITQMRPWLGTIIAMSCVCAIVPGKLMSSSLGLFGGMGVTSIILSVLAACELACLLFGDVSWQYGSMALMAVWRTITFTQVNACLPCYLIAEDEMAGPEREVTMVSATGLAFGIMSLIGGAFSLVTGFLLGHIFKAPNGPAPDTGNNFTTTTTSTTTLSPSLFSDGGDGNITTTTPTPTTSHVAPAWVFVTAMSIIWALAVIIPIPLAIRCFQLQKRRDIAHHHQHKHPHHKHHSHHHNADAESVDADAAAAAEEKQVN